MTALNPLRLAQAYRFLSEAFLYPAENWTEDLDLLDPILGELGVGSLKVSASGLETLQAAHRRAFGLAGSLCYETECGLPGEFRMSQELADLAGFYEAFGFRVGGLVRERPDHIAVELEFLSVLTLKQSAAEEAAVAERVEVCQQAQRAFLRDHAAQWVGLLATALEASAPDGPYPQVARTAARLVDAHARALGVEPGPARPRGIRPTPPPEDLVCQTCDPGGTR